MAFMKALMSCVVGVSVGFGAVVYCCKILFDFGVKAFVTIFPLRLQQHFFQPLKLSLNLP